MQRVPKALLGIVRYTSEFSNPVTRTSPQARGAGDEAPMSDSGGAHIKGNLHPKPEGCGSRPGPYGAKKQVTPLVK